MTTPAPPTAVPRASTSRHFLVQAAINGVSLGVFDTRSGGTTTAETAKHTPGSAPSMRVALGGPRDTEDVTISRAFVATRDHDLIKLFQPLCGLAEMTVTQQPYDKDGRPLAGRTIQWTGILTTIGPPEYDANSSDVATFEVTMTCDGDIT